MASLQEISRAVRESAGEGLTSTSPAQASAGEQVFYIFPYSPAKIFKISRYKAGAMRFLPHWTKAG